MNIERDTADIRALLYRLTGSYSAKDVDGVLDTFVADAPMLVGTGSTNSGSMPMRCGSRWIGIPANQMPCRSAWPTSVSPFFGDAAFVYADMVITATFGEQHHRFPIRMTFGLVRTDNGWRVAQAHTSVAEKGLPEGRSFSVQADPDTVRPFDID